MHPLLKEGLFFVCMHEKIEDIGRCPPFKVGRVLGKEHERERVRRG